MGFFTNYTISADCFLQFFYIVRREPMLPGGGVPDPNEFIPQLRVHSFQTDYDHQTLGFANVPSSVSETRELLRIPGLVPKFHFT